MLSSPLFTQERQEPASRRQSHRSPEENLLSSQSSFTRTSTERPVYEPTSDLSQKRKSGREMENETIKILLERQKEQILAEVRTEILKHEFQADSDRSILEFNGIIESQRSEINRALAGDEHLRRDQQFHHEEKSEQHLNLREAHIKSLHEMEELKRVQGSTFDEFAIRKLIDDRDLILEFTAKIQELQNEVYCMSDSRDFHDVESVHSGQSHDTSQPVFFPPFQNPGGMLSRSLGMPSRNNGPPSIWDTHGILGNVFANPTASSSAPYPGGFNPGISNVTEDALALTSTRRPVTCVNVRFQTQS